MTTLACYRCGRETTAGPRCDCGEPLWFVPDGAFTPQDLPGMWRYTDLLPVDNPVGLGAAAGGTPLLRTERLDAVAGCRVWVKDEAENPTGSYKDRGSAVAVAQATQRGRTAIGTVSYGNMAMSTAATAASAGLDCVVLVPIDTPPVRLELIASYGPTVLRVPGDYGTLYDEVLDLDVSVEFYLSDPPERIAGYATCVHELVTEAPDPPDALALPASSGGFASGVYRGLLDCRAANLLTDLPRLYVVQTAASDPITRAFEADAEEVSSLPADEVEDTVATSIGNPAPPSGTRALAAARATGGAVVSVTDDELTEAKRQFAERAGLSVEASAAAPLAGVQTLGERGELAADESVVLLPTGTGFKEAGTGDSSVTIETVERDALRERLTAVGQ